MKAGRAKGEGHAEWENLDVRQENSERNPEHQTVKVRKSGCVTVSRLVSWSAEAQEGRNLPKVWRAASKQALLANL